MKDRYGIELEVGQRIVYATKSGCRPYLQDAVVQKTFDEQKVKAGVFWCYIRRTGGPTVAGQRSVHLRYSDRIIILGEDNAEDSAERTELCATT